MTGSSTAIDRTDGATSEGVSYEPADENVTFEGNVASRDGELGTFAVIARAANRAGEQNKRHIAQPLAGDAERFQSVKRRKRIIRNHQVPAIV